MSGSSYSIKTRLIALIMAGLVPAVVMVLALIFYYYQQDVAQSRVAAIAKAQGISDAVDSRMASVVASLETLASSELLARGDLEGFHRSATAVARSQQLTAIALHSTLGVQLLNTSVAYGTPLPKTAEPQIAHLTQTGKKGFTDLFRGPVVGKPILLTLVPVAYEDGAPSALGAAITPNDLRRFLTSSDIPPNWFIAMFDNQGTVMARSVSPEQFVGQKTRGDLWAYVQQVGRGTFDTVTLDGVPIVSAFHRSALTGWTVAVGVPRADLTARLETSLLLLLTGAAALVLGSLALANFYGRQITQTIATLAAQAAALGRGEVIRSGALNFREAEHLATALKQSAEQLAQAKSELVQRNLDLQQFAFVASHDLRVPLKTVTGFLSLLKRRYSAALEPKAIELIDRTTGAVASMDQLTLDLLAYARLDSGAQAFVPVDCQSVVDDTVVFLDARIRETQALITTEALPTVLGDRSQLIQLFQNLIGNALTYCADAAPIVVIRAERGSDEWLFSVTDNGIGIDAQHHQRIFEVFKRLHTAQEFSGNGIGLAVCQRVVDRHGGRIWVDSQPGHGSTFYFSIADTKENSV